MKTYILIGGIGAGKSTVSALLSEKGARCIDLDEVGSDVLDDPQIALALSAAFGRDVLGSDGKVDRAALAEEAFATPAGAERLGVITHPAILARTNDRLEYWQRSGVPLAVVEASAFDGPDGTAAPLLSRVDGVIAVMAPPDVRVARAVASGMDESDVRSRMDVQPDDAQFAAWADFTVENGTSPEALQGAVDALWAQICPDEADAASGAPCAVLGESPEPAEGNASDSWQASEQ